MAHLLSDEPALPGLIWAMRFDAAGRGRLVEPGEDIPALGRFGEGFVWLHVNLNDARVPGLVAEGRFGPPDLAAAVAFLPIRRLGLGGPRGQG